MTTAGPVLVLNAGSSSIKGSLFEDHGALLWHEQRSWPAADSVDHSEHLTAVLDDWLPQALEPWLDQLQLIGHRVVHGGEKFRAPTHVSAEVLSSIESLVPLAPLHNGPALAVMRWVARWQPSLPQWACFDTAFHATLPENACTYALPISWRQRGLRRFGFHGLNHQHISEQVGTPEKRLGPTRLKQGKNARKSPPNGSSMRGPQNHT
jgi:acetate kinase